MPSLLPRRLQRQVLTFLAVLPAGLRRRPENDALAQGEGGQVWPRLAQIAGRRGRGVPVLRAERVEDK